MTDTNIHLNALGNEKPTQKPSKAQNNGMATVRSEQTNTTTAPKSDSVFLTESARNLMKARNNIAKESVVDLERVDQIKKAIARGDYPLDTQRIAEKMIELEMLLGR